MYCPWWECIDEDGSISCHWYDEYQWVVIDTWWRWIDVVSLVYNAFLGKCIDDSLLYYHDW